MKLKLNHILSLCVLFACWTLMVGLSGMNSWVLEHFCWGIAAGFVYTLLLCTFRVPRYGLIVAGVLSIAIYLFWAASFSQYSGVEQGIHLGVLMGFGTSIGLHWKSIKANLLKRARTDNVRWVLRALGDRNEEPVEI